MRFSERIPAPLVGERLDRVVAMIASCTRTQAVEMIESDRVKLSGKVVSSKSLKVQINQEIVIDTSGLFEEVFPQADESIDFGVVFEDQHLMVIDKPAGLVVHPGSGNESGTLVNGILARFPGIASVGQSERPGIVHRLDKNTSGLMIVARTQECYEELVAMMATHSVERIYTALAHGNVESERGIIEAPIGRSASHATQMAVSAAGREALTHYLVKKHFVDPIPASLMELRLETGRTHQIRVHLKAIGHPVIGDTLYSRNNSAGLKRIFLHSSGLNFVHPITSQELSFISRLPLELESFLLGLK